MDKENTPINKSSLKDYLQWDIFIWGKALSFWTQILKEKNITTGLALEIGSKDGGLSLYLANEFDFNIICSDLNGPTENAKELHKKFSLDNKISYKNIDAINLGFDDNIFDVVFFKSVLGSIGKNNNFELQQKAIHELYRVLKPEGILLFAENAKASFLHSFFRNKFRKWASYWRYVTIDEMSIILKQFRSIEIRSAGFFSVFFSNQKLKKIIYKLDIISGKIISKNSLYVIYGYAIK